MTLDAMARCLREHPSLKGHILLSQQDVIETTARVFASSITTGIRPHEELFYMISERLPPGLIINPVLSNFYTSSLAKASRECLEEIKRSGKYSCISTKTT